MRSVKVDPAPPPCYFAQKYASFERQPGISTFAAAVEAQNSGLELDNATRNLSI